MNITAKVMGARIYIHFGKVHLYTLAVNDRFLGNGYRRPRNAAIHLAVYSPINEIELTPGSAISVSKVLELFGELGLSPDALVNACEAQGWSKEIQDAISQLKLNI